MIVHDLTNFYPYIPKRKLWLDAAISATASHINSVINYLANNRTNKANKEINQQQIDYAREAFEKEKDYNNWLLGNQRQLQMQDSKAAGVNPAFAQGSSLGGASINPSMNVPNQIPMDYNFDASGISNGVQNMLQYLLQKKQVNAAVNNLDADTQKKLSENDILKIEREYLPAMRKGQISIMESTIAVNGSNIKLNDEQCKLIAQTTLAKKAEISQINARAREIEQNIDLIDTNTRIRKIEEMWKSQECQAIINNLQSSAYLSREQAHDLVATRVLRIANLQGDLEKKMSEILNISADTASKYTENAVAKVQGEQLMFNLDSDKSFKNAERIVGLINGVVNSLATINDAVAKWVPLGKLGQAASAASKQPVKTSKVSTPPVPYD